MCNMYGVRLVSFFCNGLFVTVTLLTVTFCTIKTPYGAHNGYTIFLSNLVSFHFAFLYSALIIITPLGGGEAILGFSPHPNNTFGTP